MPHFHCSGHGFIPSWWTKISHMTHSVAKKRKKAESQAHPLEMQNLRSCCCCSVTQSCLALCDPMSWSTLPFSSLSPRVFSNSSPLSWWCYPTISFCVAPFSSCLQSFPAKWSRKTCSHLLLWEHQNHNCWTTINRRMLEPTKKQTNKQTKNPCLRAKEKPQQDGRRGAITKK